MADKKRKFPYGYVAWILILFLANAWFDYRFAAREDTPLPRWVAHTSMLLAVIAIIFCAAWWWSWRKK